MNLILKDINLFLYGDEYMDDIKLCKSEMYSILQKNYDIEILMNKLSQLKHRFGYKIYSAATEEFLEINASDIVQQQPKQNNRPNLVVIK